MNDNFDYEDSIRPLVKRLCESDKGEAEANFGQMSEIIKKLAMLIAENPNYLDTLERYSDQFFQD